MLSAMAFGNLYGFANFGVFFSLMQIAGNIWLIFFNWNFDLFCFCFFAGSSGSVLNPIISGSIFESTGSYLAFPFMWAGLLIAAAALLIFVPITEYKR